MKLNINTTSNGKIIDPCCYALMHRRVFHSSGGVQIEHTESRTLRGLFLLCCLNSCFFSKGYGI